MSDITPIFLFSLPRSGSTLVQRVLASQPGVATTSEPWLLLPVFQGFQAHGIHTTYDHSQYRKAFQDFCSSLPGGDREYLAAVRRFALDLYEAASTDSTRYFLDKTPRYHTIARLIMEAFPDAKFIFLWRNPLAVAASMMSTWAEGRWNLYRYRIDFYAGLPALIEASRQDPSRCFCGRYEDLLLAPELHWRELFDYLELPYHPSAIQTVSDDQLTGRMGDPVGPERYEGLSREPLEKWKTVFTNPLRKRWGHRYLRWIGSERLSLMGYRLEELLAELDTAPSSTRFLASDAFRMTAGALHPWLEPHLFRDEPRLERKSVVDLG